MKVNGCALIITVLLISALEAWALMELWNWIVPQFWNEAPVLTFWKSLGLLILIHIISSRRNK